MSSPLQLSLLFIILAVVLPLYSYVLERQLPNWRPSSSSADIAAAPQQYLDPQDDPSSTTTASGCTSCSGGLPSMTDDEMLNELKRARVEYFKAQLLLKLRLAAAPNISVNAAVRPNLPDSLVSQNRLMPHASPEDRKLNDFYGRTEHYYVFASDASVECMAHSSRRRTCLQFDFSRLEEAESVASAKLYIFGQGLGTITNDPGMEFQVKVLGANMLPGKVVSNAISRRNVLLTNESGWLTFEITKDALNSWFEGAGKFTLEVTCKHCSENNLFPYSEEYRPFMLVALNQQSHGRAKRSNDDVNCSSFPPGSPKTCCRETYYVSFREIQWTWVIQPTGFHINFCRGACGGVNGMELRSIYPHTAIAQKVDSTRSFVPCCAPTRMSAVSLIFQINTGEYKEATVPNMSVDQCGCF